MTGIALLRKPRSVALMPTSGDASASDVKDNLLRWGGLAGMLSAVLLVLTAVTLFGLVPRAPASPQALVARYPDVRFATTVGETFSLASVIVFVPFLVALYMALRRTSPTPAAFGTGVGFLGVAVLAVEGVPDVAYAQISNLYHAPGATPQDQATLALIWQTTQGLFSQYDTASFILLALAFIILGVAMLRSPTFGKGFGGVSIALGLAGLIGVYLLGITSAVFAPVGLGVLIILPFLLGWKVFRLSRAT